MKCNAVLTICKITLLRFYIVYRNVIFSNSNVTSVTPYKTFKCFQIQTLWLKTKFLIEKLCNKTYLLNVEVWRSRSEVCCKMIFLKISENLQENFKKISWKAPLPEPLFINALCRSATLLKSDTGTGVLLWIVQKFSEHLFYKQVFISGSWKSFNREILTM